MLAQRFAAPSIYGSSPRTLQTSFAPPLLLPSRYYYWYCCGNFQFDYRYCRRSSCDCRLARLCAHSGSFFGYGPTVSTVGTNGLLYSREFAYRVIARELALALTYKKSPWSFCDRGEMAHPR